MLQASLRGPMRGVDLYGMRGVDLYGGALGAAADANVKALQTALWAYASQGHPEANPGATDGVMNVATRNAVVTVVTELRNTN